MAAVPPANVVTVVAANEEAMAAVTAMPVAVANPIPQAPRLQLQAPATMPVRPLVGEPSALGERQALTTVVPLSVEEVMAQAKAEGLTLERSGNAAGYRGVKVSMRSKSKPFQANVKRGGKNVYLGNFATAEEAALCYARTPDAQAAQTKQAAMPEPMTADEALAKAEEEGLVLQRSNNVTGFKHVAMDKTKPRQYQVKVWRNGKQEHLGYFCTAEEAALCYARTCPEEGRAGSVAAKNPVSSEPPLTAEEALLQAEQEGLSLQLSDSKAGYRGVKVNSRGKAKPYEVSVRKGGKPVYLGSFATAEEAALRYARATAEENARAYDRPLADVAAGTAIAAATAAAAATGPPLALAAPASGPVYDTATLQQGMQAAGLVGQAAELQAESPKRGQVDTPPKPAVKRPRQGSPSRAGATAGAPHPWCLQTSLVVAADPTALAAPSDEPSDEPSEQPHDLEVDEDEE